MAVDYAQQAPTDITGILIDNNLFFSGLDPLPVNQGFLCMRYNRFRAQMSQVPLPVRFGRNDSKKKKKKIIMGNIELTGKLISGTG